MKTFLLLVSLSLTASAQQAFVFSTQLATNVQNVPAKGIIAAHTITSIAQIANVAIIDNGTLRNFDQSAIRIISITTNLVDKSLVQKPLLSAQRPRPLPQSVAKAPPPRRDASTNVVTIQEITNTPAWKRAHHIPPFK